LRIINKFILLLLLLVPSFLFYTIFSGYFGLLGKCRLLGSKHNISFSLFWITRQMAGVDP